MLPVVVLIVYSTASHNLIQVSTYYRDTGTCTCIRSIYELVFKINDKMIVNNRYK